ncbi:cspE, partial [Symbiodinium necroappetens]
MEGFKTPCALPTQAGSHILGSSTSCRTPSHHSPYDTCNVLPPRNSILLVVTHTHTKGKVKSYNQQKGFGFIECDAVKQQYKRDVFLHKQQAEGLQAGDCVNFEVELNQQGNPQARNVVKIVP